MRRPKRSLILPSEAELHEEKLRRAEGVLEGRKSGTYSVEDAAEYLPDDISKKYRGMELTTPKLFGFVLHTIAEYFQQGLGDAYLQERTDYHLSQFERRLFDHLEAELKTPTRFVSRLRPRGKKR